MKKTVVIITTLDLLLNITTNKHEDINDDSFFLSSLFVCLLDDYMASILRVYYYTLSI